ncbi:MAG: hypothetical protein IH600_12090 [Bacteroidetes bacterium]|nr:hypothetical protein [Bacteroidota bacterium]
MDVLQDILLLVLLVGGIVLVFVVISVLRSTKTAIENISNDIRRLSDETIPVLAEVREVAEQTSEALKVVSENREKLTAAAEYVRKVTENIYRLENLLQEQVEPGVAGLARRLSGIRRGIDVFLDKWRAGR